MKSKKIQWERKARQLNNNTKIKTTLQKGSLFWGCKPRLPARVSRRCFHFVQAYRSWLSLSLKGTLLYFPFASFFSFFLFIASCSAFENGFAYSFTLNLSIAWSCISCSCMYFATVASFSPTVLTYYPSLQKCLFPNLYFKSACRSNIINADFPLRYPTKSDTAYFGGIITNICTWSFIKCPSMISTPLYLHNVLNISPKSFLYWL